MLVGALPVPVFYLTFMLFNKYYNLGFKIITWRSRLLANVQN